MDKVLKPGLVLGVICIVAAVVLSIAYQTTLGPIHAQEEQAKTEAMKIVLPAAEKFEEVNVNEGEAVSSFFVGKNGNEIVGYAIFTEPKGYGGPINMLTGIDADGIITGISIVGHSETPGLGANATEEEFRAQYIGKTGTLKVTKSESANEDEIVAMTSATITTDAVTVGVNEALSFFDSNLKGGQ